MTSSEADRIVDELADLPPEERAARLEALALDPALRAQVERVLAHVDALLDEPDALPGPDVPASSDDADLTAGGRELPDHIGPYAVKAWLGAGGMGVVYRAEQSEPRRDVALKLLDGRLIDPDRVRRFEREAELLGRLQHPGVAQIHALERTPEGEAFLVMEYVEGQRLTAHADAKRLDRDARVALLADLAEAVHHAHIRGVLHRDLKPANVLVTDDGQVKVIDFGVARALDEDTEGTLETLAGQVVGTLAYMSPEQLRAEPGGVDGRADVYALGALAYELLGGLLPHDVTTLSLAQAARVVCEEDPTPLGRVAPQCRGDLEHIVQRALAKEPDRRYQSAQALADDLRRYLADEPVQARAPSAWYQASKFARRHRGLVAGFGVALLAILVGAGVALDYALENKALAKRESEARDDADDQKLAAQAAAAEAARNAEAAATAAAEASRNAEAAEAAAALARDETVRAEAEAAAAEQARLAEAERADELARVVELQQRVVANVDVVFLAGFLRDAVLEEVTRRAALGGLPEDEVAARRAAAEAVFASIDTGQIARSLLHATLLEPMKVLIGRMLADKPLVRAQLLYRLAGSLILLDYTEEAAQVMLESASIQVRELGNDHPDALDSQVTLAGMLQASEASEQAAQLFMALEEPVKRVFGSDHQLAVEVALGQSNVHFHDRDFAAAVATLREALEPARGLTGEDVRYHAFVCTALGSHLTMLGEFEEAERMYREALGVYTAQGQGDRPAAADVQAGLATALRELGRSEEGLEFIEVAVATMTRTLGRRHENARQVLEILALHLEDERPDEARRLLEEVTQVDREEFLSGVLGRGGQCRFAVRLTELARSERALELREDARAHVEEALAVLGALDRRKPDVAHETGKIRHMLVEMEARWPGEGWDAAAEVLSRP